MTPVLLAAAAVAAPAKTITMTERTFGILLLVMLVVGFAAGAVVWSWVIDRMYYYAGITVGFMHAFAWAVGWLVILAGAVAAVYFATR